MIWHFFEVLSETEKHLCYLSKKTLTTFSEKWFDFL
jgi:hypothetical protein